MFCLNCDNIVISGKIFRWSAKISFSYQEYRYIEDRYNGVLSHTFYCKFCWDIEYSLSYGIAISRIDISGFHCNDHGKVLKNFKPLFLFPVRIIRHCWSFRTETQLLNHLHACAWILIWVWMKPTTAEHA